LSQAFKIYYTDKNWHGMKFFIIPKTKKNNKNQYHKLFSVIFIAVEILDEALVQISYEGKTSAQ